MHTTFSIVVLAAALTAPLISQAPAVQASAAKPAAPAPLIGTIATHPDWPQAKSADVASIDSLVTALYDVISGPAGQARDWQRFRSLFVPEDRLGIVRPARPAGPDAAGNVQPTRAGDLYFISPELYVQRSGPMLVAQGFFEHGIANRVETFGNLTSVWSTYESRHTAADATPFARGVNSIQIIYAQGRYWIASILWDDERPGLTLPPKYLQQP